MRCATCYPLAEAHPMQAKWRRIVQISVLDRDRMPLSARLPRSPKLSESVAFRASVSRSVGVSRYLRGSIFIPYSPPGRCPLHVSLRRSLEPGKRFRDSTTASTRHPRQIKKLSCLCTFTSGLDIRGVECPTPSLMPSWAAGR